MKRRRLGVRSIAWLALAGACDAEPDASDPPDLRPPVAECPLPPPLSGDDRELTPGDIARDPLYVLHPRDAGADGGDARATDAGARDGAADASPTPTERCGDGIDDDGDGSIDEGCPCLPGDTQACYGGDRTRAGRGECARGTQRCEGTSELGAWGRCEAWVAPAQERCDGRDNDCDDAVDEDCGCALDALRACYGGPAETRGVGGCHDGSQRCAAQASGPTRWGDCGGETLPEEERCDGVDNDCDGATDEGCRCDPAVTRPCYEGPAGTQGVGRCHGGAQRCVAETAAGLSFGPCVGQVLPEAETCGNAVDDDCNGALDCSDPVCRDAVGCADGAPVTDVFDVPRRPVEVLLLVDGSSSMARRDAHGVTRRESAMRVLSSLLPDLDDVARLGLLTFPVANRCEVAPELSVTPFAEGSVAVLEALNATTPSGGTPLDAALGAIERYHDATAFVGERVLVLVTDGAESCSGSAPTRLQSLWSTHRLPTYVLGMHGDVCANQALLQALAVVGGRRRLFPPAYYSADDETVEELRFNLRWLATHLTNCTIELSSTPSPRFDLTVSFDDVPVPPVDWSFADASRRILTINGSACTAMATARVRVITARYGAERSP